jgi:hypothetical protein
MRTSMFMAFGLAIAVAACGPGGREDDTGGDDSPPGDDGGGDDQPPPPPPPSARCQAMDIVFVVDDSGSMQEEQSSLATNFPQFAAVLDSYEVAPGQLLDYRVALTTTGRTITTSTELPGGFPPIVLTEVGDNGAFRNTCGSPKRWIDRTDGNLNQTLSCRAQVGTSGPGAAEMSLYMPMMALSDRITDGTNAGFLRDDALLALVVITDEDDCSRTDDNISIGLTNPDICTGSGSPHIGPTDAVQFFDALKGDRGRWAAAVVAGPTACTSAFGMANEAHRLKQFVSEMNLGGNAQNGVFASICDANMAASLQTALDTFQAACESFPPIE